MSAIDQGCASRGGHAQGNYSLYRDGFCKGPEVPLCDPCGRDAAPSLGQLWENIKRQRLAAARAKRGVRP